MRKPVAFFLLPLVAACLMAADAAAQSTSSGTGPSDAPRSFQSFNPDISAIVDLYFHHDDSKEGMGHVFEELAGFGHAGGHGEEDQHEHGGIEDGFNLRHLELMFSGEVDPYFKASAIAAVDTDGAELETAEIETTCLPWGLKLRGGKFYSDFGYINAQHAHAWDFADQPLIYQLTLGSHGLNEKGVQISWLAPTPFYLLAGVEAFQGENENLFAYHGEAPFPSHDGPRLGVGWLKVGPNLPGNHALQFGAFGATGSHQEEHAEDEGEEFFDGDSTFWGGDVVYKYNAPKTRGQGDVIVQAEYFSRRKELQLVANDLEPEWVGNSKVDNQDGYYAQAVYGLLPRWRAGVRWEQVGLTNETEEPDGTTERFGSSDRAGVMLDFTPSEFSRIRLQVNRGAYETADGRENVTEAFVQWVVSFGAHGAHKF